MVWSRRFAAASLLALTSAPLCAQTIDDGTLMRSRQLCTGFMYQHDRWDTYWEGTLKRSNGNIGSITTQSVSWVAAYGVSDRLNVIAMLPYVWTEASQGTLRGLDGVQDLTLAAKYRLLSRASTSGASFRAIAVASAGTPVTDYTPDFLPLSIGLASRRVSGRLTLNGQTATGWFANASAGYTWRGNVTLDRISYYDGVQLYLNDRVEMPGVLDYTVSAGYMKRRLTLPVSFSQQNTRGGSDIRRQDMPFVSNRMNFSRIELMAMYTLPTPQNLAVRVAASRTLSGRNVGQSTTFTAGLLYTLHF